MNPKQVAQRWFEEVWNKKNPAVIDELMEPTADCVSEGGTILGPAEFRSKVYDLLIAAFPDVRISIDGLIAEGEDVVIRWTVHATHKGPFGHLKPSGKRVKFSGMTWQRIREGQIVCGSDSYNLHGLVAFLESDAESTSVRRG